MSFRYGLPYKGSKNAIAKWIVESLPRAETFVDLFFGGGAVTHAALLSGKYKKFIANDIDGRLTKLFLDCCYGKYTTDNHSEWISREEFHTDDENWEGLYSAEQIISITYDTNHGCYVVFWKYEDQRND